MRYRRGSTRQIFQKLGTRSLPHFKSTQLRCPANSASIAGHELSRLVFEVYMNKKEHQLLSALVSPQRL